MFHILLDTEVFRHEHLRFASKRFQQLAAFVDAQEATVYVADVTIGEVRRAIATAVTSALDLLPKKTRAALGVLAQTDMAGLSGLLQLPDKSVLIEELNAMFNRLLADLKAVTLSSDEVSVAEIRRRYFEAIPPFSSLAAKKHEFPDALFILAAERHTKSSGHILHVVSADEGIAEAAQLASGLESVATLAGMITKVHETVRATAALATAAEHAFAALTPEIVAKVKYLFEDSGIDVEDEWEGEVSEVEVSEVDLGEPTIDQIEGTIVTLGFLANISFTADVTVGDPDQTAYDSETGDLMIFGYLTKNIHTTEYDVEGTIEIEVDTANVSESEIRDVTLFADNITVRYPWPC
jgi:PIN domain